MLSALSWHLFSSQHSNISTPFIVGELSAKAPRTCRPPIPLTPRRLLRRPFPPRPSSSRVSTASPFPWPHHRPGIMSMRRHATKRQLQLQLRPSRQPNHTALERARPAIPPTPTSQAPRISHQTRAIIHGISDTIAITTTTVMPGPLTRPGCLQEAPLVLRPALLLLPPHSHQPPYRARIPYFHSTLSRHPSGRRTTTTAAMTGPTTAWASTRT